MNKGPLRKVIDEFTTHHQDTMGVKHQRYWERLECGHVVRVKTDMFGETNAYKRRCKQCLEQKGQ